MSDKNKRVFVLTHYLRKLIVGIHIELKAVLEADYLIWDFYNVEYLIRKDTLSRAKKALKHYYPNGIEAEEFTQGSPEISFELTPNSRGGVYQVDLVIRS